MFFVFRVKQLSLFKSIQKFNYLNPSLLQNYSEKINNKNFFNIKNYLVQKIQMV